MIIETATFIPGKYENRVAPRRTFHQAIDKRGDVLSPLLYIPAGGIGCGMFIGTTGISGLNHRHLRQGAIRRVSQELRSRHDVLQTWTLRVREHAKQGSAERMGVAERVRNIHLPGNLVFVQKLKNSLIGKSW